MLQEPSSVHAPVDLQGSMHQQQQQQLPEPPQQQQQQQLPEQQHLSKNHQLQHQQQQQQSGHCDGSVLEWCSKAELLLQQGSEAPPVLPDVQQTGVSLSPLGALQKGLTMLPAQTGSLLACMRHPAMPLDPFDSN